MTMRAENKPQTVPTTQSQKPQQKPQQKKENIVIEFTSLPEVLRTKDVRSFYDKDSSGFLESSNSQGQDEYALMEKFAQSKGVDLSNYKSDIATIKYMDNDFYALDKNGKTIKRIVYHDDGDISYCQYKGPGYKGYMTRTYRNDDFKLVHEYGVEKGVIKEYLDDGSTVITKSNTHTLIDKDEKIIAVEKCFDNGEDERFFYDYKTIIKGKNCLEVKNEYKDDFKEAYLVQMERSVILLNHVRQKDFQLSMNKFIKTHKPVNQTYYLNGDEVQAKPIGKGRYEVTLSNGEVKYISHDGNNLKPEYVRNNP